MLVGDRLKARLAPRPTTRLSTLRVADARANRRTAGKPVGFSLDESDRPRRGDAHQHRPGQELRADRRRARPRLHQPEQPARVGARLRRVRRPPRRRQRAAVRRHGQSPRRARRACASAASTFPPTPGSSARCTTPPTTRAATTTSMRCRRRRRRSVRRGATRRSNWRARENALERSRRFDDAPLHLSPDAALQHVEERSAHLAQPRPEYGHCTNAICIVGRRELTRGLHLDRRAFLVSYDPTHRQQPRRPRAHPGGGRAGRRRHQPRVLLLVGRQRDVRLRHQAAAQRHRPDRRDERPPERPAHGAAAADGRDYTSRCGCCSSSMPRPRRCWRWRAGSRKWPSSSSTRWVQLVSVRPGDGRDGGVRRRRASCPTSRAPALLPRGRALAEWHMRTRDHVHTGAGPQRAAGSRGRARATMLRSRRGGR